MQVPADGSVKFVNYKFEGKKAEWLDYAAERKGRFVGLANKDGSTKTECGIHVVGELAFFLPSFVLALSLCVPNLSWLLA